MTPPRRTARLNDHPLRITEPEADSLATYRAGLRLMALRVFGETDTADDVAQETIARALTIIRSGDRRIDHLGAFIHGIARYVIADLLRAREHPVDAAIMDRNRAADTDALEKAVTEEERAQVHEALAALSSADRDILRLSYFDGLTPREAARRLGESPLNIRKRKSRALERLRKIFLRNTGHDSPLDATDKANGRPDPGDHET